MRVFFRVDSNAVISGGHVARCLALAGAFRRSGYEAVFLTSDANPAEAIASEGFAHVVVGGDWRNLLSDSGKTLRLLETGCVALLVVDSYSIEREFVEEAACRSRVCYLGSKAGYLGPLDALVNYSTDVDVETYRRTYVSAGTALFLGPGYAPLREQFATVSPCVVGERVGRILLTTGGTDPHGMQVGILDELMGLFGDDSCLEIVVVVGLMSPWREELERRSSGNAQIRVVSGVRDMAGLMRTCDLAVSANGTTVYELAACGVPAVTFAMVEEQRRSGEGMSRLGMSAYCGCAEDGAGACLREIAATVGMLMNDRVARRCLAETAHKAVDGNGAARVVMALEEAGIAQGGRDA